MIASQGTGSGTWKMSFVYTHTGKAEELQQHMTMVDLTGSIRFTRGEERNNDMPFLEAKLTKKGDGSVKSTVYRKKTNTDQYLNFVSHHPRHQKLGVVRTLMNRYETKTSEEGEKEEEEEYLKGALRKCGYPSWAFKKAMKKRREKSRQEKKKQELQKPGCHLIRRRCLREV